jgi:hypothetical protein
MTDPAKAGERPVRAKDVKWLREIGARRGGMYPGQRYDLIPDSVRLRLERQRLVEVYVPHNPAHKDRLVLTYAGESFLAARDAAMKEGG